MSRQMRQKIPCLSVKLMAWFCVADSEEATDDEVLESLIVAQICLDAAALGAAVGSCIAYAPPELVHILLDVLHLHAVSHDPFALQILILATVFYAMWEAWSMIGYRIAECAVASPPTYFRRPPSQG